MPSYTEIKAAVSKLGSHREAADHLGLSRHQVYRALRAAKDDGLELRKVRDETSTLRNRLRELEREIVSANEEVRTLRAIRKAALRQGTWRAPSKADKQTRLVPILFTSDFQVGEVIKAEQIDGINSYDPDIFVSRYQELINSTIDLADNHVGKANFPGIIYLRGGDSISGGIHQELLETDRLTSIPAVKLLLQQERQGIKRLKERFGRVRVISVPGNHDRNTIKSQAKNYWEHSYQSLLTWWLETLFEDDPDVEFQSPPSGDAYFVVEGWRFLLSHGDRAGSKGGQGFVGPAATIARAHQKLKQNWASSGKPVDYVLTGHFHTSVKLEHGFGNGSLAGYSEFGRDLRCNPDAARQWLLFVHKNRGVASAFDVQCGSMPTRIANQEAVF